MSISEKKNILYLKVHLSWIIDLDVKAKIIKLLEENLGEYIYLVVGKNFLEYKIDVRIHNIKNFYSSRRHSEREKASHILQEYIHNKSDEGLVSRKYK